jgi:hypothetical protein
MIRGSCGDHTLSIELQKDLKDDDGNSLVGQCVYKSPQGHIAIALDAEGSGLGLFNTTVHEISHGAAHVFGIEESHQTIYTLTAGICQALISTGLINEVEFEARLRALMLK